MKSTSLHDTVSTVLLVIGGVIVAALVVMFLFRATNSQLETGNKALNQTEIQNQQLLESRVTQFDGATVTGSMVANTIKTFANERYNIVINVSTGGGPYDCSQGPTIIAKDSTTNQYLINKPGDTAYINPSTMYAGSVERDATTHAVTTLTFTAMP